MSLFTVANIITDAGKIEEINVGVIEKFLKDFPDKALQLGLQVVLALVFFLIGVEIIKIIRKLLKKSLNHANADLGVIQFLDSFVKVVLYILLIFMIASGFGLEATSVLAVVGSAGVAIGLALQGSLSNFAGGVLILLLKPFKVGDYIIEDNKKNEGTVSEIQLFYTKLVTPDDKIIVLPNGTLANTSLTNVTTTYKRRLDVSVGISYDSDLLQAKSILLGLLMAEEAVLKEDEIYVFVDHLSESSVVLGLRCFVRNEDYWTAKCALTEAIKLTFDKHEIKIPYPQMNVYVNKVKNNG